MYSNLSGGYGKILCLIFLLTLSLNLSAQTYRARMERGRKWFLIDEKGTQVGTKTYGHLKGFSEGLAGAREGNNWGYIDENADLKIFAHFFVTHPFSSGIAAVSLNQGEFYYIDQTGKAVIPGPFVDARPCTDGVFFAKNKNEYNFRLFNDKGKEINPMNMYKEVSPFKKGYATVKSSIGDWQIINTKGEVLYQNPDCSFIVPISEGMFPFRMKGKWGFIDTTFKASVLPIYNSYTPFNEGYARVETASGEWMLIDKTGATASWSTGHDKLGKFSNGLLPVMNSAKLWGYVNTKGELVIPYKYVTVKPFSEGIALVKTDQNLWGYLNTKGEWVIKPTLLGGRDCRNGFVMVKHENGLWGFISYTGVQVPGKGDHAYSFDKLSDSGTEEEENNQE